MSAKYRYRILFWSIFAVAALVRCIGFFVDVNRIQVVDLEGLYVMHESDLEKLSFSYEVIAIEGRYVLLRALPSAVTFGDV